MRIALYHIFKKNGIFLLALLLCFIGMKAFTMRNLADTPESDELNRWISQCADLDAEQVDQFVSTLGVEIFTKEDTNKSLVNQYSQLLGSYRNYKDINNLISFSKLREGELPATLPPNYMDRLDFYQNLNPPKLIHEETLSRYFQLQNFNVLPIIVVILIAFFSGSYFETGMYRFASTSPKGKKHNRCIIGVVLAVCIFLLIANECCDFLFSGLIFDKITLQASIQSYGLFKNSQMNLSVFGCLMYIFLCKIIGLLILAEIAYCFAKKHENTKDTLISSLGVLLICFLIGKALSDTPYSFLLQFGIINWETVIENVYISSLYDINTMFLGTILMVIISLCANACLLLHKNYMKTISRYFSWILKRW